LKFSVDYEEFPAPLPVMFWLYGGGFVMGDATEENYLPGPLLDTKQVKKTIFALPLWR
jgi:carboxylesterase type B